MEPVQTQPGAYPPPGYPPAGGYPQQGYPAQAMTSTVVVTTQPQVQQLRGWSSGLCDCFNDFGSCFMGWFCPCALLTQISSRMGEGCCYAWCCPGALLSLRIKLRVENNIEGNLCDDHISVQFCGICVLCQMSRELDHVGK